MSTPLSARCLDVDIIFPASLLTIDAVEVSLAIIFGLFLGILIALLCSKCFFKELAKERIQQSQKRMELENLKYEPTYPKKAPNVAMESESTPKKRKKRMKQAASSASMARDDDDTTIESYDAERQDPSNNTLIYALITTTLDKTQIELSLQDFRSTHVLEEEIAQERSSANFIQLLLTNLGPHLEVMLQLLQILLGKFVTKGKVDESCADDFVDQCIQTIHEAEISVTAEHRSNIDELKNNPDLAKDSLLLQEAVEHKWPEYQRNMAAVVQNVLVCLRDDMSRDTTLTDEEIDALVTKLIENMTAAEAMIGQETTRQSMLLEDRLARRQALSEQYMLLARREHKGNLYRAQDLKKLAGRLCESEDLTESQMQSIVKQYEEDLARVQENHQAEVVRNSQQLAEQLQQHRQRRLRQLEHRQMEAKEQLMERAMKAINTNDFVQAHHNLLEQQRCERNDLSDELDYHDAEELSTMRKQLEESRAESINQQEKSFFETIKGQAKLNKKEMGKMIRRHTAQIKAYEEIHDNQRKQQQSELQERIETHKTQCTQWWQKTQMEQQQLMEQQRKTVSKYLGSQAGLKEESNEKIMLHHQQDTEVLKNHLQMTRLRHQKVVAAKLAKKRARVMMLHQKQEIELLTKEDASDTETEKLVKEHEEHRKLEEQDIESEEGKALLELRKLLAKETDLAIKEYDTRLSTIIAKMQVGQAIRQTVIRQQDNALIELQEQMVDLVLDSKTISERKAEKIMEQHFEHLAEMKHKIAEAKDHQDEVLQQKIEVMKMMKEKTIVAKLEEEKRERKAATAAKTRKIKISTLNILNKILEDNRQKQEQDELDQEMKVEMARKREELNAQLEDALEKELQFAFDEDPARIETSGPLILYISITGYFCGYLTTNFSFTAKREFLKYSLTTMSKEHKMIFLGQLAVLSKMSKEELNEMILTAVEEGGGEETTAKKIFKDMNKCIKSAKAQPEFYESGKEEKNESEEEEKLKNIIKKKKKVPVLQR